MLNSKGMPATYISSVEDAYTPVVTKLRTLRCKIPRGMIFCRRYEDCAGIPYFSEGGIY